MMAINTGCLKMAFLFFCSVGYGFCWVNYTLCVKNDKKLISDYLKFL